MVTVTLWGSLAAMADGQKQVEVEAKDIRELFRLLGERYPALRDMIENDIAVSINGVIYRDTWSRKLPEGAEIFLMRRLAGG
jgi:molybdopterin converting factor small subunit